MEVSMDSMILSQSQSLLSPPRVQVSPLVSPPGQLEPSIPMLRGNVNADSIHDDFAACGRKKPADLVPSLLQSSDFPEKTLHRAVELWKFPFFSLESHACGDYDLRFVSRQKKFRTEAQFQTHFQFEQNKQRSMPNTPSAKKALRQSDKHNLLNRAQRSALRTAVKKVRAAAAGTDAAAAAEALRLATKKLDQAASKHLIHKNAAARTKSRLAKLVSKKPA